MGGYGGGGLGGGLGGEMEGIPLGMGAGAEPLGFAGPMDGPQRFSKYSTLSSLLAIEIYSLYKGTRNPIFLLYGTSLPARFIKVRVSFLQVCRPRNP